MKARQFKKWFDCSGFYKITAFLTELQITYILKQLARLPEEKLANKVQRACKELASHDQIIPDKEC